MREAPITNTPQNIEGKYEINDDVLGRGAWSVVKRCVPIEPYSPPITMAAAQEGGREGIKSKYVVKIIEKEYLLSITHGDMERATLEVKREIDVLRHIPPHANVAEFVEHFETDKHFLLIFEEVSGGDLCELILDAPGSKLPEAEAKNFTLQSVLAVLHCHLNDVVHRDIKPENLLVAKAPSGRYDVKLTDFGLAKRARSASTNGPAAKSDTQASTSVKSVLERWTKHPLHSKLSTKHVECLEIIGTPRYGAPEMFYAHLNKARYDGYIADSWSVGVVAYIMLTGSFPFSTGANATEKQMYEAITKTAIQLPTTGSAAVSEEANDFVRGLLCKDHNKRMTLWEALDHPWLVSELRRTDLDPSVARGLDQVLEASGQPTTAIAKYKRWKSEGSEAASKDEVMAAMAAELEDMHNAMQQLRTEKLRGKWTKAAEPSGSSSARPGLRTSSPGPGASAARRPISSPAPSPNRPGIMSPNRATPNSTRNATPPRRIGVSTPTKATTTTTAGATTTPARQVVSHRDPGTTTPNGRTTSPLPSVRVAAGTAARHQSPLHRATPTNVRRGTPVRAGPTSPAPGTRTTPTPTTTARSVTPTGPSVRSGTPTARSGTPTTRTAISSARSGTPTNRSVTPTGGTRAGRTILGTPRTTASAAAPGTPTDGFKLEDNVVFKGNRAVVRFHGTTTFGPGVWMGLEMLEGTDGTNDGTSYLDKKRYFTCPKGKGVFVRASQVKKSS